jgi:hypothetical protein
MDDDMDDIPALKAAPAAREKTKAEKDREADEAFRKAAEDDGMFLLSLLLTLLTESQHKKPKKQQPHQGKEGAGVSAAGSAPKRKLIWARSPTNLLKRNSEKNPASSMTPNSNAGSTRKQAPRIRRRKPLLPHRQRPDRLEQQAFHLLLGRRLHRECRRLRNGQCRMLVRCHLLRRLGP